MDMKNDRSQTSWFLRLRATLSSVGWYLPVAYFGYLSVYSFVTLMREPSSIPSLALVPFIYLYLTPLAIVLVLPFVQAAAFFLYGDLNLIGLSCASIFILVGSLALTIFVLLGLVQAAENPLMFQSADIVFICISLFKIVLRTLQSTEKQKRESDFAFNWLGNLNMSAYKEIAHSTMVGFPIFILAYLLFDKLFILGIVQTGLLFLSLNYFLHAVILLATDGQGLSSIGITPRSSYVLRERSQAYLRDLYQGFGKSAIDSDEEEEELEPPQS